MTRMPLDERVFVRAQKLDRGAMEALLSAVYPSVHRLAAALTGRIDVARGVERWVMKQGLRQLLLWRNPDAAERWFYHHTLLTSRRAEKHRPEAKDDLLATKAREADAAYLAFLRALRDLPFQQREAFLLHHGEKFNSRYLGVAMDCSTRAAEQHLLAAEEGLRKLAGDGMGVLTQKMAEAYARLTPEEDWARPTVRRYVRNTVWPRRVIRAVKVVLALALIGVGGYYGHRYRERVEWERVWKDLVTYPTTMPSTQPTTGPTR